MSAVHVLAVGRCLAGDVDVQCHAGHLQLSATIEAADPERLQERLRDLSAWPLGRFEPAYLNGHRGWQVGVTDRERAQIVRWWVIDGQVFTVSGFGPVHELLDDGARWIESARFEPWGPISAPPVRGLVPEDARSSPHRSSSTTER